MIGRFSGPAQSMRGMDPLRDGRALPSSMVHFWDATRGTHQGVVTDYATGGTLTYPGDIGFDATGCMTGITYAANPPIIENAGSFTLTAGDATLVMCCGTVVDSHVPIIRKFPTEGLFGVDPYAAAVDPAGASGYLVIEDSQYSPDVVAGDPGAIAYFDDTNALAHRWSRKDGAVRTGSLGVAGTGMTFDMQLGPSSTAEAFIAVMRWTSGNHPPLQVVKDAMAWMWVEWGRGNYTIYPPLLNY